MPVSGRHLFRAALEARELAFEDEAAVEEALFNWQDSQGGFSDCLIVAHNRQLGCRSTATFDAQAARLPGASKAEPGLSATGQKARRPRMHSDVRRRNQSPGPAPAESATGNYRREG
jgi:hypothetical protein